ncbi:hypothetical protein BDQ17DRAFT_1543980 [Cyathus striatus]|nr:hypothetical protein BDQ17DRAFT_1543980 [Cyathus striatus]
MQPQTSQYHIFSLPPELLASLTPRNLVNKQTSRAPSPEFASQQTATGPRACNVCLGVNFRDVDEQRTHFRSDWHKYNVKIRLRGGQPVGESQFAQLVEGLEDSLSGSASSSSEDEASSSDAVSTLLQKSKKLHLRSRSSSPSSVARIPQSALIWFHSPPHTQIGIYRTIFPPGTTQAQDGYLNALKDMQEKRERTWAMFMVAGGHFAGALVRVSQDIEDDEDDGGKKKKQKKLKQKVETEVLKHKTFHRYTTRRKQGGSQSVNDNAKGPAKSAGAQLRRYGEQALREDIRGLLEEWAENIDDCELVWIRASTSNRRIFLGYDEAPIKKGDERLRTFPFPTRRPTQSELTRCLAELVRPKVSHFTEEELKEQDEAFLASLPKPRPVPVVTSAPVPTLTSKTPKLTKEEEAAKDKWLRALDMASHGRVDALKAFLSKEGESLGGVDTRVPEFVGSEERGRTLLMVAASQGQEEIVNWLLEEARADPTVIVLPKDDGDSEEENEKEKEGDTEPPPLPKSGKRTAYDLAKTKTARDVFRRCAYAHPEWHDWLGAARVPSVLSPEMEEQQEEKKKVRRKGLKDRVKEREAKEREKEKERAKTPEPEPARSTRKEKLEGPRRLGGAPAAAEGLAGLTPEMRMKVERERRARAAEARLKALGGGGGGAR